MVGNRPIKKWRSGSIEVCVWQNEKEMNGSIIGSKTVSLTRSWKKSDDDVWRSDVINLRKNDIGKVMMLLNKAHEEVFLNQEEEKEGE